MLVALGGFALGARSGASAELAELSLDFRDAELETVVELLARATQLRILWDSPPQGRVTLALEERLDVEEARQVLNAVLLLHGYALAPAPDDLYKLLPLEGAPGGAPWVPFPESDSERFVVAFLRLDAADARELARVLEPRTGRAGLVQAYAPTNSLILATTESLMRSWIPIVRALDRAALTQLRVIPLRYVSASKIAEQLSVAFPEPRANEPPSRVVTDERTNSLIVEAQPARLEEIEDFIASLDIPLQSKGSIRVVSILNADADQLAESLRALGQSSESNLAGLNFDIVVDRPSNSLVVRSSPEGFRALADLIAELDRIPPRVAIDVHLMEIETSYQLDVGFDAVIPIVIPGSVGDPIALATIGDPLGAAAGALPNLPFVVQATGTPLVIPLTVAGVPTTIVVPEGAARIVLSSADATVHTLMRPHLLAASGEEQRIFAGDEVPIPVSTLTADPQSDGFVTSVNIERHDTGIDIRVLPLVVSDNLVELDLSVRVSSVAQSATSLLAASTTTSTGLGPILNEFEVNATVRLIDGMIALIASAPREVQQDLESSTPFFRSIPYLGRFFRTTRTIERRARTILAVQATTIASPEEQRANSIQRRLAFERYSTSTSALVDTAEGPYALRVASFSTREMADRVASDLAELEGRPTIEEWVSTTGPRYDVYLVGFASLPALAEPSVELRARGFQPKLSVLGR
jgi:general secretion pathway protein D